MYDSKDVFDDYENAKKEADKLYASYTRTLNTMKENGLVKHNGLWYITDKGKDVYVNHCE